MLVSQCNTVRRGTRTRAAITSRKYGKMSKRLKSYLFQLLCIGALFLGSSTLAQDVRGPVTNLPMPRFVSLKASKANVRRGPSLTHRIDWVFTRRDMPLEITAEHGHWRRVQDREGQGGWVHYSLLSGVRTVLIEQDMLPILVRPEENTATAAHLELGVVARLGECSPTWCKVSSGGYKGWAPKTALWGVKPEEIRE